jgi:uncharacterized protein YraI
MSARLASLCIALACVLLPNAANAQLDTTRRATTVRAGPDSRFPLVTRLPNASNVRVFGCTSAPRWCDIQAGRTRGWVPINDLRQTTRVMHAPVVTFSVEDYWNAHYRTRAWFSSKDRWIGWGTPGFVPPTGRGS